MATKINILHQNVKPNAVITSAFLVQNGLSRSEQVDYVRSGWLTRLATGVYCFNGEIPTLYSALGSYAEQSGLNYHVGAYSALEQYGYSHNITMTETPAVIFTHKDSMLPSWFDKQEWGRKVRNLSSVVLGEIGIEERDIDGIRVRISTPERAFMECLLLVPEQYALMDLYYIMEMLNTLRPKLLMQLLMGCSSVKIKRLFMYMAEKANHPWWRAIDATKIDLGTGTRSFAAGGVKDKKYNIVIPRELAEFE